MKKKNSIIGLIILLIIILLSGFLLLNNLVLNSNSSNKTNPKENNITEQTDKNIVKEVIDYSGFIGRWNNLVTQNEFIISNITDKQITFTWVLYRLTSFDDVTILFENGKGVFYFKGVEHDYKEDKDIPFLRKATIVLVDNGVDVLVEDVDKIDNDYPLLENDDSWSFVKPGTYDHFNKEE